MSIALVARVAIDGNWKMFWNLNRRCSQCHNVDSRVARSHARRVPHACLARSLDGSCLVRHEIRARLTIALARSRQSRRHCQSSPLGPPLPSPPLPSLRLILIRAMSMANSRSHCPICARETRGESGGETRPPSFFHPPTSLRHHHLFTPPLANAAPVPWLCTSRGRRRRRRW